MSTVFAVQKQMKWDTDTDEYVPKFNLDVCKEYGKCVFLLSPTAGPFNSEGIITDIKKNLAAFTPDDFLLLVGNPCIIGWVVAIAASKLQPGQALKLLQWSGKDKRYLCIESKLF